MSTMKILLLSTVMFFLLSGCIAIPMKSKAQEELPNLKSQIIIGETSREVVRQILGEPFIVYKNNNLEVYRAITGSDWVWGGFVLMPLILEHYDVIVYAMVSYDDVDIVNDLDWGLFGRENVLEEKTSEVNLEVGGLYFTSEKCSSGFNISHGLKACEYLFLDRSSSKDALHAPASDHKCQITIGTGGFVSQVSVDKEAKLDLDYYHSKKEFIQCSLPAGSHTISMDRGAAYKEEILNFNCAPGERLFVYPIAHEDKSFWKSEGNRIEIVIDNELPDVLFDHKRLLFYEGIWLEEY